jgi:hypothetical protein
MISEFITGHCLSKKSNLYIPLTDIKQADDLPNFGYYYYYFSQKGELFVKKGKRHWTNTVIFFICSLFLFLTAIPLMASPGDVDDNGNVELRDVILSLGICSGLTNPAVNMNGEVNGDTRIGLPEATYAIQFVAGMIPPKTEQIIADHTVVDQYENIPDEYINEVKKMFLSIPGQFHGRGYLYGLLLLEALDLKFAVNPTWAGEPEAYATTHLRAVRSVRNMYNNWSDSQDERDIWTSQIAIDRINSHMAYCKDTLLNPVDVFGWGWCWDMTGTNLPGGSIDPVFNVQWAGRSNIWKWDDVNSQYVSEDKGRWGLDDGDTTLTGNSINMNDYCAAFDSFRENNPETAIFFSTGPVDGGGNTGERGYQRWRKHEYIRDHVKADQGRILFDYADILCHSPGGVKTELTWTDHADTVKTFPGIYSAYTGEYDGGEGSCHISEEACLRLGKTLWWMMARMAGWNGQQG